MFRQWLKSQMSKSLRIALRQVATEWQIQRLHRSSSRRARLLAKPRPMRLNLASGVHSKPGWVNVDLFTPDADLRLDLREPLPFEDKSADFIYAEHFFEHLDYPNLVDSTGWALETPNASSEALGFLRECWRILVPGGVLDLAVPDAEGLIEQYVQRRDVPFSFQEWWGPKWCDTTMHCVNYLFRQGRQHKYAYDEETLRRVLESSGFVGVVRRGFDPSMDAPNHEIGSLFIQGTKPPST